MYDDLTQQDPIRLPPPPPFPGDEDQSDQADPSFRNHTPPIVTKISDLQRMNIDE